MKRAQQLELDFETPEEKLQSHNRIEEKLANMVDLDSNWYRINKYADWWCDHVPSWLGYGIYDSYRDFRRWCISTYQKYRYGVSDEECWYLADNFARYILPRLKHFRNMKRFGVPNSMCVKLHASDESEYDRAADQWNAILDEMIWTFEYIIDEDKFNPVPKTSGFLQDLLNNTQTESDEEKAQWDEYFTKANQLNERKNKGLALFATHFDNLWD